MPKDRVYLEDLPLEEVKKVLSELFDVLGLHLYRAVSFDGPVYEIRPKEET